MVLGGKDIERFQSGVNRLGPDDCWPWLRCCVRGYGYFRLNEKMERSHRVSWVIANGRIPELFEDLPSEICHSCDNPKCCNPNHLFLGNQRVNIEDCINKGRHRDLDQRGENNPQASKTEAEIKEIKRDLQEGDLTQEKVAEKHGVSRRTVSHINTGKTWSHVLI